MSDYPKNFIIQSPVGSGKTAAYGAVLLQQIKPDVKLIQGLVVAGSYESAFQVSIVLQKMAIFANISVGLAVCISDKGKKNKHSFFYGPIISQICL